MAARPNKFAAATKSSSSTTTSNNNNNTTTTTTTYAATPAAGWQTNRVNANTPALSRHSLPSAMSAQYKEPPGEIVSDDPSPDHRPNQPYQGVAPSLRQVQQSPNLSNNQSHQSSFAVQGVFSPQAAIHSPYLNNPQQFPQHAQTNEGNYYTSNPSPRSTTSGAYYPSEKSESMATATATMQRPYSGIYHTPQSGSPASVTSPQTHDHGRPMYPQGPPQMQQPMYGYPNYQPMAPIHPSSYGHQPQMSAQSMLPYQTASNQMSHTPMTTQPPTIQSSPRIKSESAQQYGQTPHSQPGMIQQRHPTSATPTATPIQPGQPPAPPTTSNAAPGPIPATTPLVVRQDGNGVQWIAFEYSRDRVKMEYTIRCDVESVDASSLSQEFKGENCVYPRACVPKDQYKGNRLAYETDCNQVGWALAELNPCLRGKRGLIQRAVDSWRNSNQDPRLRSRRVRRQAKMNNRQKAGLTSQGSGPSGPGAGHPGSNHPGSAPMTVPDIKPPGKIPAPTQQQHHHAQHMVSPHGQDPVSAQYSTTPSMHRSSSTQQHLTSPSDLRHVSTFPAYPTYPSVTTSMASMPPSIQGGMHGYGRPGGNASMATRTTPDIQEDTELYGNLPEAKRRKFISVTDMQKDTKVRVKVTLDQIDTSEIPDSYRKHNSVFPRAYFPIQMQSATESTCASRYVGDDVEEMDDGPPTIGRTTVACHLNDSEADVEVAQISREKRSREIKLNELGYRMAWGQSRIFANRPIFLGRSLDIYRNKQRSLLTEDEAPTVIPSHLETRPGKRRWQERSRKACRGSSPAAMS